MECYDLSEVMHEVEAEAEGRLAPYITAAEGEREPMAVIWEIGRDENHPENVAARYIVFKGILAEMRERADRDAVEELIFILGQLSVSLLTTSVFGRPLMKVLRGRLESKKKQAVSGKLSAKLELDEWQLVVARRETLAEKPGMNITAAATQIMFELRDGNFPGINRKVPDISISAIRQKQP